jgi:hypothetical protein
MRWVPREVCDIEQPPPAKKTIDLSGRVVKDGACEGVASIQNTMTSRK